MLWTLNKIRSVAANGARALCARRDLGGGVAPLATERISEDVIWK